MEKEIKEIIEKNLPAQVGSVLTERLKQADQYEKDIEELKKQILSNTRDLDTASIRISSYEKNEKLWDSVSRREKDVAAAERQLEISKLKYQLDAEKDKTDFAKNVALGLVRNIEYRKVAYDSVNTPVATQYGGYTNQTTSTNSNETNKAE